MLETRRIVATFASSMPSSLRLYWTICTRSRKAIEDFFDRQPNGKIFGLPFVIYGLSFGLDLAPGLLDLWDHNADVSTTLLFYAITSAIGIGATYLALGLIHPWLMKMVGLLWKGRATISQIANVNSFAGIPYVLIVVYQLTMLAFGLEATSENINGGFLWIIWLLCFRIFIIGIAVVQGFSYGIALLNIVLLSLPFLIIQWVLQY